MKNGAARAAISWSAGKDSCLALRRARAQGLDVTTFLTMCDEDGTSKSHALPPALIEAQVAALGGDWTAVRTDGAGYAAAFDAALRGLVAGGHTQIVFGDIDLAAHREWLEPACARVGIAAVFPLWGQAREALAREIVAGGIRARIVCVDTGRLDASYCGLDYDAELLGRLPAGVCPCGEDGEFHTFVYDAPGFAHPLAIQNGEVRLVPSRPPLSPTMFALQTPRLVLGTETAR